MRLSTGILFTVVGSAAAAPRARSAVPTVNLGYSIHQATVNEEAELYAFNNIRYADAPIDSLRFQPTRHVTTINLTVNDGSVGYKCPQAYPQWLLAVEAAEEGAPAPDVAHQQTLSDPDQSEDCLFLDVVVPKSIFNAVTHRKAPVLVWIHGGGYTAGFKNSEQYDPVGIVQQSQSDGSAGVIYVALNYRLGLFGWLNGNGDETVVPNLGLHDQRLALEWVRKHVHRFGGDPDHVTVIGESAGGGSIVHQITAEGGKAEAPFKRAIIQSPGWENVPVPSLWNETLSKAESISGETVTSGKSLASLSYEVLKQTNDEIVYGSKYGSFSYNPTVDGTFVPDYAVKLLEEGLYDSKPELMVGHNSNEGMIFVPPTIRTEEELEAAFAYNFQDFTAEGVQHILGDLYPPPNKTDLYTNNYDRGSLLVSEEAFVCNTRFLADAFADKIFKYRFQVPPGYHGQDLPYTFYDHKNTTTIIPSLAVAMQSYFTNFAKNGKPDNGSESLLHWPEYGSESQIVTFGAAGVATAQDGSAEHERCSYWQQGTYRA